MATISIEDARGNPFLEVIDVITPDPLKPSRVSESIRLPSRQGNIVDVGVSWRGKPYAIKMFFPTVKRPSRMEVLSQVQKVYPGAQLSYFQISDYEPGQPLLQAGGSQ